MAKIKYKHNYKAWGQEVMKADYMKEHLQSVANSYLNSLGEGYAVSTNVGNQRANASISTTNYESMKDNYNNNTLLKVVGL